MRDSMFEADETTINLTRQSKKLEVIKNPPLTIHEDLVEGAIPSLLLPKKA